ncbi:MAG: hypothetical protein QM723_22095 [Myxococcaceae bacterium]
MRAIPLVVLALAACHQGSLQDGATALDVADQVDFGQAFAGHERVRTLHLVNHSREPLDLSAATDHPFAAPAKVSLAGGASADLMLTFDPLGRGTFEGTLHLTSGSHEWRVELLGTAVDAPTCPADECHTSHLDPELGCVDEARPDGTQCGGEQACIANGLCHAGICQGTAPSCDDGNPCTDDSCAPGAGCQHNATVCPDLRDPCLAPVCDPKAGCTGVQAPDGTPCGDNDCFNAHVCIGGTCAMRAAPEGSICGRSLGPQSDGDACHGPSTCQNLVCVPGAAQAKPPVWQFVPSSTHALMTSTVDLDGNAYVFMGTNYIYDEDGGIYSYPLSLLSFTRDGHLRWIADLSHEHDELQNGRVLTVDSDRHLLYLGARTYLPGYPTAASKHLVLAEARDTTTGARIWEHDLTQGIPVFNSDSSGALYLDINRASLLADGGVAFEVMEGFELHQSYTIALDDTGNELWRLGRSGHVYSVGATGDDYWETSAACWSSDIQAVRVSNGVMQADVDSVQSTFLAFDSLGVVATQWDQNGVYSLQSVMSLSGGNLALSPIPLPPDAGVGYLSQARLADGHLTFPTASYYSTSKLTRLDRASWAMEWNVDVPDAGYIGELELLEDGGTLLSAANTFDGGTDLFVFDSSGNLTGRCPYGQFQFQASVAGRRYGTVGYESFAAFDAPNEQVAPSGWVLSSGHVGNTHRPR